MQIRFKMLCKFTGIIFLAFFLSNFEIIDDTYFSGLFVYPEKGIIITENTQSKKKIES